MVWNGLTMIRQLNEKEVKIRVIAVSATMKKVEVKVRKTLTNWV